MPRLEHDLGPRWPDMPDWQTARLSGRGITVTPLNGLSRHLVSGDLDGFLALAGLPAAVGALGLAAGPRHAVRLSRDRMMVVGLDGALATPGWDERGFAVSDISAAFQAFVIEGALDSGFIHHATFLDVASPGPSANVPFAGLPAMLYALDQPDRLVVHVERGLAPALWAWIDDWRNGM